MAGTPLTLETDRLILRELKESDWTSVHDFASQPEVVKYETWGPNTPEDTVAFIRYARGNQQLSPRKAYELAVILKDPGTLIGTCGLRIQDATNREGDLGYTLSPTRWGQGLGTEVAQALITFGFKELKLHRIWATCHIDNLASARVLEKAGMQREGVLRKNKLQRGEWRDSILYAILETDRI